jgi:hypothetical protein
MHCEDDQRHSKVFRSVERVWPCLVTGIEFWYHIECFLRYGKGYSDTNKKTNYRADVYFGTILSNHGLIRFKKIRLAKYAQSIQLVIF